ncbi:CocE/NonD family hydrolase [bacterium]|nr:CocE/NonD family hydrolase [bacterium]
MKHIVVYIIACMLAVPAHAQERRAYAESGVFSLYKNDSRIGTIRYELDGNGDYERVFTLHYAGQNISYGFRIGADSSGSWNSAVIEIPTDTIIVRRIDTLAVFTAGEREYRIPFTPGSILYGSYDPVFETLMIRRYDHDVKGVQTFPRFLFPNQMVDATLEYTGETLAMVDGERRALRTYAYTLLGIKLGIWADDAGVIYMMDVPVQYAAYVREGCESLMALRNVDTTVSQPAYGVERRTVMMPMRDGTRLSTDLYVPQSDSLERFPVILIRTPYKKEMQELEATYWAKRGYVTAVQDCRGRFASEGVWEPFVNEPEDGYDAVEWLGTREWSSGRVGMIGGSYVGWVQLWAAAEKPPHLTTIIPNVAPPDPFYNIPYEYGVFYILGAFWWAEILESEATADLSGSIMERINERQYEEILRSLPVIDLDEKVLKKKNPYWRKWILNNVNSGYWERANFMEKLHDVTIPVFLQSGWFDGDGIGSKLNYLALRKSGNRHLKLIIGPWGHTSESSNRIGSHVLGQEAALDLQTRYLKWFDYWLKGEKNDILDEPLVMLYDMFSGRWLTGPHYPLPQTEFTPLYLSSDSGANTSRGDGRLTVEQAGTRDCDEYLYDPGDPTPYPEYYFKSEEEIRKEKEDGVDLEAERSKAAAFHTSVTDRRSDILVFQTAPLDTSLTVAGPLSAILYASTSGRDTDWFVTFSDVDEQGRIMVLARGMIRARFRESTKREVPVEPDTVYSYTIDLWQTGITFRPGHRIRVEIASALFPLFSRNLNTGGHNEMETEYISAKQRIYHSERYPSRILLPVINQ